MKDGNFPPSLIRCIWQDISTIGRFPLLLLILIFIAAISIVFTTTATRSQITLRDDLLSHREQLDNEWRNQILEENTLAEHTRVQRVAIDELDMKRPDSDKEVIVNLK